VVETAECLLDQRHLDEIQLAEMLDNAKAASRRFAQEEDLEVEWERIWNIEPFSSMTADRARREGDQRDRRLIPSPARAARFTMRPRSPVRVCRP